MVHFKKQMYGSSWKIHKVGKKQKQEIVSKKFATGRCYLDLRSGRHNMDWLGAGFYEDEYVKIDSEWRFQLRKFTALRMEELPEGINLSR